MFLVGIFIFNKNQIINSNDLIRFFNEFVLTQNLVVEVAKSAILYFKGLRKILILCEEQFYRFFQ